MNAPLVRRRVVIRGRVQGVFFRDSCRRQAAAAQLTGTVCNRSDGSVEAVFEGPPDAVDHLVAWCRHGPRLAEVSSVDVRDETPEGLTGFTVG